MDNLEILIKAILSLKNTEDSKKQIASELPKLESQLQSDEKTRIKIVAGLDVQKSRDLIQSQLNALTSQAKMPTIKIGIDAENNTFDNITTEVKDVQKEIEQTVSKIDVTDEIVSQFHKMFNIVGKNAKETKEELKTLFGDFADAFNTADAEKYYDTLEKIYSLTKKHTKEISTYSTKEWNTVDYLKSNVTDGSNVYIDSKVKEELISIVGNGREAISVLNTIFGGGKWTYNSSKGNIDFETFIPSELVDRCGGLAQSLVHIRDTIKSVKSETVDVFSGLDDKEARQNVEYFVQDILKLGDGIDEVEYDANNLSKEISITTSNIKEETKAINEQVKATKNLKIARESITYDNSNLPTSKALVEKDTSSTTISRYDYNQNDDNFILRSYTVTENYEDMAIAASKAEAESTKLQTRLEKVSSAYKDVNSNKYVKNDDHISKLDEQYDKVEKAIEDVKTADKITMAQMKANAEREISLLSQMASQYHNAEKVATQLRAKGFETVKIDTGNNIDKFINSINNSKVPIQAMQTEIDELISGFAELDTIQDQAGKSAGLTNILNILDNAQTKFQSLKELFKGFGNDDWLSVNSEQINKIDDMATKVVIYQKYLSSTREEWKQQGLYVGEVKSKVAALARSLPNIKKPEKFNEWVEEWVEINRQVNILKINLDKQVATQNRIYEIQTQIAKLNPNDSKNSFEIERLNEKLAIEQKTLSGLQFQSNVYKNIIALEEQEQYILKETVNAREKLDSATAKADGRKLQEEEKINNQIQKGIEKTIQARKEEEKRQELAQNDAINKALEEQYKTQEKYLSSIDKIQSKLDKTRKEYNTELFNIGVNEKNSTKREEILGDIKKVSDGIESLRKNFSEKISTEGIDAVGKELDELEGKLNTAVVGTKDLKDALKTDRKSKTLELNVKNLEARIQAFIKANPRAKKKFGETLDGLLADLQTCSNDELYKKISKNFQKISYDVKSLGLTGNTMLGTLKDNITKFTGWMSMTQVISSLGNEVKTALTEIKEVDTLLTEISKANDKLTKTELKEIGNNSYDIASKYGRKATDQLVAVQEMYRAGFENAEEMAELSLLAQSAGDISAESANNYIMATNAAYDYKNNVEELNKVLDSQNYITNNAAISMQDITDATSEAASIAAQYGVEIDELSALTAVAVSKTRESGAEVGTALKALFVNLQDTTSNPIKEAFDGVGISMTKMVDGSEQLKTPIELIKELSVAFNSLPEGDIRRANILNDIGGRFCHVA